MQNTTMQCISFLFFVISPFSRGFCIFNNVAVAARKLLARSKSNNIKKILILDWDIHHGNGVQKEFYNDPNVLYISIHRYESANFYPFEEDADISFCGEFPGEGMNVNIPWATCGKTDNDYIYAFQKVVMPIAFEFSPDFVIVAAGFDAADNDHLGECHVSPAGYANMTHMLKGLAGGKIAFALEGGYNLEAISNSASACLAVLLGDSPPILERNCAPASLDCHKVIERVIDTHSEFWQCFGNEGFVSMTKSVFRVFKVK